MPRSVGVDRHNVGFTNVLCTSIAKRSARPQVHLQHTQILERAHKTWEERGAHSKDARYGSRVIRATLERVAMPLDTMSSLGAQGLVNMAYPYTEPSLCGDVPDFTMPDMNYSGDYEDFLPLNTIFGPTEGFDWVSFIGVDPSFNCLPTNTQ
jgi:hypothetical protein